VTQTKMSENNSVIIYYKFQIECQLTLGVLL